MKKIDSRMISEMGYNEDTKVLTVVFRSNDAKYEYRNVPVLVWEELDGLGDSVGSKFKKIIDGYLYDKVE